MQSGWMKCQPVWRALLEQVEIRAAKSTEPVACSSGLTVRLPATIAPTHEWRSSRSGDEILAGPQGLLLDVV